MRLVGLAAACGVVHLSHVACDDGHEKEKPDHSAVYEAPSTEGVHWADAFDGDVWTRWTPSTSEKYDGKFEVEKRKQEALVGDVGLLIPEGAKHYGISASFPGVTGEEGKPFVVQYEAKFQDGLTCGGSYVKLFDSSILDSKGFDADTPYIVMFGPDRCGATDKVHFILKHKSPKTGEWEEKHFKEPPSVPHDQKSHLYALVINADNSFEIQIDGVKKASGDLLTSMDPPVNPPSEINDPEDSKPEDWVDEVKMPDPESFKPNDWDEDEPMHIPDPSASMPAGWLEHEEKRIADPEAKIPHDWDEDEDGEWEAPIIDNPLCKVGCGKWAAPTISNPAYKGKWEPEFIVNPDYKGLWKPRQIANPVYFEDKQPAILPKIDAVGIDIWTMQGGILFDNFVVSTDVEKAKEFADSTFQARKAIEDLQTPSPVSGGMGGMLHNIMEWILGHPIPSGATFLVILVALIWFCVLRPETETEAPPQYRGAAREDKKSDKKSDDDSNADAQAENKQEDKEEKEEKQDAEGDEKETENEEKEKGPKNRKGKGGLAMDDDES